MVSATVGGSGDDDVVARLPQRLTLTLSDTNSMNDLLRGVPRESSLRGFTSQIGGLLVSSALPRDSQRKHSEASSLSENGVTLQSVLGHSWRDGRWKKCFSLLLLFNGRLALAVSFVCFVPMMFVANVGVLRSPRTNDDNTRFSYVHIFAYMMFWLVVCFGHKSANVCRPEPKIFLDKRCVHRQSEANEPSDSQALGTSFDRSERMVVCFNNF